MSNADLAKLSKGINSLKKMTTSLLSTRKKRRAGKKSKAHKKSKAGKKTKGKKGRKGRRTHAQRGGSTISYSMPGRSLVADELNLASPAPIAASEGHKFYDMTNAKGSGSFI